MDGKPIKRAACWWIYMILTETLGANEEHASSFVGNLSRGCVEWRFQGTLGFGGKFWNANDRWYVTCYPEDSTDERRAVIAVANERLARLKANYDTENAAAK
jgi:hypothetical protein